MNLKKNHYSRRALALLLTLVMCVGMIPTAFAAQQNSYHDPAEHWMQASGRTNELDANSVVTRETFKCGECGKATSFEVFRVPEYTRNGQPALSRNVKYSDGTMVDGVGKGDTMDGIPGKDATYTGYHYTKAVCETCGGINTNMSKSEYGYNRTLTPDTVQYVGIASDEPVRLRRLQGDQVSLLEKYHYTEEDAKQLCQTAGLLSPVYAFTDRGGCWFCPNAKRKELRHLYDNHPELWAKMLELQAMPGKVSEKFNRTERFSDIDAAFRKEDALYQKAA